MLKVNQRTLDLYGARDVGELLAAGDAVFDNSDMSVAIAEISKLWNGETSYQTETINYTLDRRALIIRLNVNCLESVARPWDRMLMALEDFTEQKRAERLAAENEAYARALLDLSPVSLCRATARPRWRRSRKVCAWWWNRTINAIRVRDCRCRSVWQFASTRVRWSARCALRMTRCMWRSAPTMRWQAVIGEANRQPMLLIFAATPVGLPS